MTVQNDELINKLISMVLGDDGIKLTNKECLTIASKIAKNGRLHEENIKLLNIIEREDGKSNENSGSC